MHQASVAQQWAQDAHQEDTAPSLLEEYKQHEKVFDEEGAKCFSLKREGASRGNRTFLHSFPLSPCCCAEAIVGDSLKTAHQVVFG